MSAGARRLIGLVALIGVCGPGAAQQPAPAVAASNEALATAARRDYETTGVTPDNLPVFYGKLKSRTPHSLAFANAHMPFPKWRRAARAQLRALLLQPEEQTPFAPQVVAEEDRGSYTARLVVFNVTGASRTAALMLVPKGEGPFPAVLALHDHGAKFDIGKEKLIAPLGPTPRAESGKAWVQKYYGGRYIGDELAKRGFAVLATDALGWGDRMLNNYESQQALASNLFNLGSSWAGLIAVEDVRAAEFLAAQPFVDRHRVAALGFSMGAFRAWQVAALTDTVAAAVAINWMGTVDGLMVPGNNQLRGQSAFSMLHPGFARYFDYPDAAAIAAPKPMLFYAGEVDRLFPLASVQHAFTTMRVVWAAAGAPQNLETRVWPVPHIFIAEEQEAAFAWLQKTLAPHNGSGNKEAAFRRRPRATIAPRPSGHLQPQTRRR
ncbi:dienelactone hydrolase family protein [Sphingomonas crusticola]|uniref:dienelactone hydrolase family protein n=1 Tax=Sphingomonas crusticola TaxID=1697973 RepID=UPI000E27BBC6|nr:alpha/beta fold hydrolase [Sphingomonas crusticola]